MVPVGDGDVIEPHGEQLGDGRVGRTHGVSSGGVDPTPTRPTRRDRAVMAEPSGERPGSLAANEGAAWQGDRWRIPQEARCRCRARGARGLPRIQRCDATSMVRVPCGCGARLTLARAMSVASVR